VNFEKVAQLHLILAAVIATAACNTDVVQHPESERDRLLDRAFSIAESDPDRAIALFTQAGPGPSLENTRMAVWADCLERTSAGIDAWREYLEDRPPASLGARAHLALVRALADSGALEAALDERSLLEGENGSTADEILFATDDQKIRLEAAQRLVITRPSFLSSADRELDRNLASRLPPEERLERAAAWRRAGRSSRAASELRGKNWAGDLERRRRRELARAELESGSPTRALNTLPSGRNADAEDHLLRAQALRSRGWYLFPGRNEQRYFRDCVAAADTAIALESTPVQRQSALVLRLECATQTGRLSTALESWRMLEADCWRDARRDWLGRRLGVALARTDHQAPAVREIARSLPAQERCLRFWTAVNSSDSSSEFVALAGAPIADLYGQWSRQALAPVDADNIEFTSAVAVDRPPYSVERLLTAGDVSEALRQWRRVRHTRSTTPAEALAAAELAADHGWATDSIRWLLSAFPELGTVDLAAAPINAIRAYLPLRWSETMKSAANESGIDPWLIAGIARQESGLVAHAKSPRGAVGVLQLLPSTARLHAKALGLGSQPDLEDPELNLRLGARELGALIRRFGAIEPALAAYNGGLTRVRGWWKRWPDRRRFTEEIPVPETYNYVRRVVFLGEAYRQVYREEWSTER
jgi:soluble lytic murein transglycosylase